MNVFLDTDVIIDYLTDRKPFSDEAEQLFGLIESGKIRGHTSSLSFSNLYYLIRQHLSHARTIALLRDLATVVRILKVDKKIIQLAQESDFRDFEDAIQHYAAAAYRRMDLIITRNSKDYKHGSLPVMTTHTLLMTCQQPEGR